MVNTAPPMLGKRSSAGIPSTNPRPTLDQTSQPPSRLVGVILPARWFTWRKSGTVLSAADQIRPNGPPTVEIEAPLGPSFGRSAIVTTHFRGFLGKSVLAANRRRAS